MIVNLREINFEVESMKYIEKSRCNWKENIDRNMMDINNRVIDIEYHGKLGLKKL